MLGFVECADGSLLLYLNHSTEESVLGYSLQDDGRLHLSTTLAYLRDKEWFYIIT